VKNKDVFNALPEGRTITAEQWWKENPWDDNATDDEKARISKKFFDERDTIHSPILVSPIIHKYDKCNRCWKYNVPLGQELKLCPRCVVAIEQQDFDIKKFRNEVWYKIYCSEELGMLHVWIPQEDSKPLINKYMPFNPTTFTEESEYFFEKLKIHEGGSFLKTPSEKSEKISTKFGAFNYLEK